MISQVFKVGLNLNFLEDLYEIICVDNNPQTKALTIIESAKYIILNIKLEEFLNKKDFKFSDVSVLKIAILTFFV